MLSAKNRSCLKKSTRKSPAALVTCPTVKGNSYMPWPKPVYTPRSLEETPTSFLLLLVYQRGSRDSRDNNQNHKYLHVWRLEFNVVAPKMGVCLRDLMNDEVDAPWERAYATTLSSSWCDGYIQRVLASESGSLDDLIRQRCSDCSFLIVLISMS